MGSDWRLRSSLVAVCAACAFVTINAVVSAQRGGRGGAGPSPGAVLWMEQCAGCHGTDAATGRARNLFDESWLNRVDDARLTDTITNGLPDTEDLSRLQRRSARIRPAAFSDRASAVDDGHRTRSNQRPE